MNGSVRGPTALAVSSTDSPLAPGEPPQLSVDERDQLMERRVVAGTPLEKQRRDLRRGTFQYRSRAGQALMTPGCLMLGSPGQCFECGHEHAEGDRCVSFWYSPEYFERLAADTRLANRKAFVLPRIPSVRTLAPVVAAVAAKVMDATHAPWDELGVELAARAVALANGMTVCHRSPVNAEARVTHVLRLLDRCPQGSFTLDEMAQETGLSPDHWIWRCSRSAWNGQALIEPGHR